MPKPLKRLVAVLAATLLLAVNLPVVMAYHENDEAEHAFADDDFWETWARTDLPVSELRVERTWIWGPSPFTPGMQEEYADGERLVQYFDKSRMEINDESAVDDDLWYVTQGRLVAEMVEGRWQTGEDAWDETPEPADQNIAGDPGEHPTYADINDLDLQDAEAVDVGETITATFEDDLTIGDDETYANAGVTAAQYVPETDHTVASPFWEFMTSQGLVFIEDDAAEDDGLMGDGEYVTDELFENAFYATGYPITEAYWSTVAVGGTEKDVLWQCFERRCLTYTPTNEATWQVEMGNVGQHYYRWRYETDHTPPPVEPDFDVVASGLVQPRGIGFGADGTVYVAEAGLGGDDCITLGEGEDAFEVCTGVSGQLSHVMGDHTMPALSGLPSMAAGMDIAGPHDVIVDGETIYALVGFGFELTVEMREDFGEDAAAFGTLIASTGDGGFEIVADLLAYETANNPDGGHIDSNPFSLVMVEDGFVVSDAGANALLHVAMDGTIHTLAVFPSEEVEAPPFLGAPPGTMIPMEAVPTGVTVGPDGAYYVGQLTGFPFVPGAANVWRVMDENDDGDTEDEGEVEVYASGFTNIIDVAFDGAGNLYVLEMLVGGLLNANPEDPSTLAAGLTMVAPDGTQTDVPTAGLIFATGLGITAGGEIYVSHMGVMGDQGQLVQLHHSAEPQP